ncbi:MAG: hypothetical protein QOE70_221 [Chthoniobacter sp.]|nr:hypothetical protein [Chthoniobacter sp.]
MTDSDYESNLDEMERSNLQKAISEVETALAVSTPGTRPFFEGFLQNAKGRVATLDKKIKESHERREARAQEQVAVAYLAQKEAALSASEKETYSGFLGKEFFTKNDFRSLEKFYANTWERLSESGKDEMSHRIWEGIRRDEYTFSELPKSVREKEMEQAYKRLRDSPNELGSASRIPESDRVDFIRAYEGGRREEASKILDRESFKQNMALTSQNGTGRSERAAAALSDSNAIIANVSDTAEGNRAKKKKTSSEPSSLGDLDLSSIDLKDVEMKDSNGQVSPVTARAEKSSEVVQR